MEPKIPSSIEKPVVDPRRKTGRGLDFWAEALYSQGLISEKQYKDFISTNNSKEEIMEKRGVPQLSHYGLFGSVEEIRQKLAERKDERFVIRCTSKATGEITRLVDTSLDEACDFAEKLSGQFDEWKVEMKEFVDTKVAGTIIVEPSGKTSIETWEGAHYLNTENVPKYHGHFDPNQFDQSFHWEAPEGATNLVDFQNYAMQALRYVFPHLKPKTDEPVYIEYGVKPNNEIYFIEVNDSPLLTGGYKK